jgi:plastocyanin
MARSRAAIVLFALALVATACGGDDSKEKKASEAATAKGPTGPQSYAVDVDAPSPEGGNLQFSAFYPAKLVVRPGDTVTFDNRSTQAPHTVTFGVKAFAPEAPFPATKAGLANPVVFGPCYTDALPPPGSEACPAPPPATPPSFRGAGLWNSGALLPAGGPPGAPTKITVAVAATPGSYNYGCLLHRFMTGTLEVAEKDEARVTPDEVARQAAEGRSAALASAAKLGEPSPVAAQQGVTVASGWSDEVTAVNKFSPIVAKVKAGERVTWKSSSLYEPHTVTFVSPFKSPEEPGTFIPGGVASGARYAGGFAHSGLIGVQPFPAESFSLVFTKAGTYPYVCVLHPGMAGQVEVT